MTQILHSSFVAKNSENRAGFTIVELLIVVVVVGILATLTVVSYVGLRNRAVDTQLKVDSENAAKQLAVSQATDGVYPSTTSSANNGQGLSKSSGTTYQYTVNNSSIPPTYCLSLTNPLSTTGYHISNDSTGPTSGLCAGHVSNPSGGTLPVITSPIAAGGFTDHDLYFDNIASMHSAATGTPTPTVQWQVMTKNTTSGTWVNIPGQTSPNLNWDFGPTAFAPGDYVSFRAVYTNSAGSVNSFSVRVNFYYLG